MTTNIIVTKSDFYHDFQGLNQRLRPRNHDPADDPFADALRRAFPDAQRVRVLVSQWEIDDQEGSWPPGVARVIHEWDEYGCLPHPIPTTDAPLRFVI